MSEQSKRSGLSAISLISVINVILKLCHLNLSSFWRTCNDLHQNRGHLIRPTETFHRKLVSRSLCAAPKSCGCTDVPWCTSIYYANAQKGYSTYVLLCARQQFSYKKQNGRFKKKKSRSPALWELDRLSFKQLLLVLWWSSGTPKLWVLHVIHVHCNCLQQLPCGALDVKLLCLSLYGTELLA